MEKNEMIKRAKDFVLGLKKEDKVAVLHHTDADGVCSGVLAAKAVEFARGKKADITFCQRDGDTSVTEATVQLLKKRKINKVIITDLAVDETPETIRALSKFAKILIIDHHLKTHELDSGGVLLVKAEDISGTEPARYPASKMAYDLFSGIFKEDVAWIAGVGIMGDYAGSEWVAFLSDIESKIPLKDLQAAEELIGYSRAANQEKGVEEAFRVIYGAKSPDDVAKSGLSRHRDAIEGELLSHKKEHKKTAMFIGDMVIYEVKSKHNIKSRLANELSHDIYPDKTVILLQVGKNRVDISARRQDMKKSMAELVRKAVEGIPESLGGGHVPAAGGYFPRQYLEEVKKRLIASASQS